MLDAEWFDEGAMGARFRLWVHRWAAGLGLAVFLLHGGLAAASPSAPAGDSASEQAHGGGAKLASGRPSREKLREMMAATQTDFDAAASLLDAIAVDDFDDACKVLVNRPLDTTKVMYRFLDRTQDVTKARRAIDFLLERRHKFSTIAKRIAEFPDDEGTAVKQQLLREMVDKEDASSQHVLIADLVDLGFTGKVQSPGLWQQIMDLVRADSSAAAQLDERIARESKVFDPAAVLSAIKANKLDMLAFLRFNYTLQFCTRSMERLRACGEDIQNQFGTSAPRLHPEFAGAAVDMLSNTSRLDHVPRIAAIYKTLGLDLQTLVDNLCQRARRDVERDGKDAETIVEAITTIDPTSSCRMSTAVARVGYSGWNTLGFILQVLLVLAPAIVAGALLRQKYKPVREALVAAPASASLTWGPGAITGRLNADTWKRRFDTALRALGSDLERNENDASRTAAAAIARLDRASLAKLTEQVRLVAIAALKHGLLRSTLARIDGMLVYTLVFPGRHDDPRSIRRYTSLADGWLAHMEMIGERLCKGQDAGVPLLALLVFLRTDASEGSLLFGYDDGQVSVSPGLVLEESECRKARGKVHADAYPLPLA